jgi:hypothetical protein
MNNRWAEFLEQEQKQELMKSLSAEGYQVIDPQLDTEFDLLARKGNEVIAFEIKLSNRLADDADQLESQRRMAMKRGYTDFRLMVLHPPRETDVDVAGIEQKLKLFLNAKMPPELAELAQLIRIRDIQNVSYREVHIDETGIAAASPATAIVEFEADGVDEAEPPTFHMTFPFKFDALLNRELAILEATCRFDLRDWYE